MSVAVLLGADGAQQQPASLVGRTRQSAAHRGRVPHFVGRDASAASGSRLHLRVNADEFRPGRVVATTGHEVPGELQSPVRRRTHVGPGYHDGGGPGGPAHDADWVLVEVEIHGLVLPSVH